MRSSSVFAARQARGTTFDLGKLRLAAGDAIVRNAFERRGKGPATAEDYAHASRLVENLLTALEATEVHITAGIGKEAIRALLIYGKQVGHPAQLNMGDVLSYAYAKACQEPLLYKGSDFFETELA